MKTQLLFLFLIFSVFFTYPIYSQNGQSKSEHKFELTTGFNFTSIRQIENSNSAKPFLGIQLQMPLNDEFSLKSGAEFAYFDFSNFTAYPKIRNSYLRLRLIPQVKIANFVKFGAGLQGSLLLNSAELTLGNSCYNASIYQFESSFNSSLDYWIGFDIDLYKRVSIGLNASASVTEPSYALHTFQFSVNYNVLGKSEKLPSAKDIARQQILDLRNGVLLVRLKSPTSNFLVLEKAKSKMKVQKIELSQIEENQKIMKAFRENFTFCPVYFFTSDKTLQVKNGFFSNAFLDSTFSIDSSISLPQNAKIFIAEFGNVNDDGNYGKTGYKIRNPGNMKERMPTCQGGTEMQFSALVLYDSSFVQLKNPFPYYVRTYFKSIRKHPEMMIFMFPYALDSNIWSYEKAVKKMNNNLGKFFAESKSVR